MQTVRGSRGDYTVRAVLYLARHSGVRRRREISEAMDIPDAFLPQIMGPLVRTGITRSVIGRSGGYELARLAEAITLRGVVAVEGGVAEVAVPHQCPLPHLGHRHPEVGDGGRFPFAR